MDRFTSLRKMKTQEAEEEEEEEEEEEKEEGKGEKGEMKEKGEKGQERDSIEVVPEDRTSIGVRLSTSQQRVSNVINIISEVDTEINGREGEERKAETGVNCSIQVNTIMPCLEQDAFEHYLFFREYMHRAGNLWSNSIAALALYTTFSLLENLMFVVEDSPLYIKVWSVVIIAWLAFFFGILPIVVIANVNSYVFPILHSFNSAAPEDFEAIGGRQKWITFIQDVPAAWEIYGFWLTYDRITAVRVF